VNCEFVRRHLIADEAIPPDHIHLCYNGVDLDEFHPEPRRGAPGSSVLAALSGSGPVIGAVSALRPEKDLGTLLRAFDLLARSHPALRLAIVGHGPSSEHVQSLAAGLEHAARVHIEPGVPQVSEWLHAFDIFVLPSLSEAFSNALLEAMACGCAVVASDTGGNPEIVGRGADGKLARGLLFPPGDAAALERVLETLLTSPELRQRVAAEGTAFVRANFSLDRSARRMEEIYTAAIARSGR
jgi:glycosyltransferase involved in cell wall biosynthesis